MPTMEVTTVVGCTLMCTFCPQLELRAAYGGDALRRLSLDDYKVLLQKIPRHVRIDFSGMAEPWLNPEATDMFQLSLVGGYQTAVYTTLEGMSPEDAARVISLMYEYPDRVEVLCLHLPDAQGNMRGWRVSNDYKTVLGMFLESRKTLPVGTFQVMTMAKGGDYHQDISGLLKTRAKPFRGHSRAGSLSGREIDPPPTPHNVDPVSCKSTPYFDRNVLLPNGDVVLCCMDYNLKHVIGNLHECEYYDLFRSDVLRDLIVVNQQPGFSACSICKSCDNVLTEVEYLHASTVPSMGKMVRSSALKLSGRLGFS